MERYGKINASGAIEYAPIRHGALITANGIIFNATEEDYNSAGYYKVVNVEQDGTDEVKDGNLLHYIGAPVTTEYTPTYEERVVELIRQKYSLDEELALLRQQTAKAEEYQAYYDYCESCKAQAKSEYNVEG